MVSVFVFFGIHIFFLYCFAYTYITAGKTEATKQCLQYLSYVGSQHLSSTGGETTQQSLTSTIEERVLATNPVLESFGNSKTTRNNNSSRFGKWLKIIFSPVDNETSRLTLTGAHITQYLLEKTRVVHHAADERNYHIFYKICSSPDILGLAPATQYKYLNQAKHTRIDGVDDRAEYELTVQSMDKLGFSGSGVLAFDFYNIVL